MTAHVDIIDIDTKNTTPSGVFDVHLVDSHYKPLSIHLILDPPFPRVSNGVPTNKIVKLLLTVSSPKGHLFEITEGITHHGLAKLEGDFLHTNTIVMMLYHIEPLRKFILASPACRKNNVVSTLQRTFANLEQGKATSAINVANALVSSTNCDQTNPRSVFRVILTELMKQYPVVCDLFRGEACSFVICRHCTYDKRDSGDFFDLCLNSEDSSLMELMRGYVMVHQDPGFDTGNDGLQEAIRGVELVQLPPILCIKVTGKVKFPFKVDFTELLPSEGSKQCSYRLHAIVSQKSGPLFVKPRSENFWYKLDNTMVSKCNSWFATENVSQQTYDKILFWAYFYYRALSVHLF